MLFRAQHKNSLITWQSPLLQDIGVSHGFTTRVGGISEGCYASLNLAGLEKDAHSDANTHVAENFRRLRAALKLHQVMRVTVRQVHGAAVWVPPARPVPPAQSPAADAMVSDDPRQMLTIRTADCVPLLMATRDGSVVAAVHAGWRGIVAGVVPAAVIQLAQLAYVSLDSLRVAIGPCIGPEHFEVGPEVAEAFKQVGLSASVLPPGAGGKPHIDLQDAVKHQLLLGGIVAEHIDGHNACTYAMDDQFFSHRRDQGQTGRMAAVIAARPRA